MKSHSKLSTTILVSLSLSVVDGFQKPPLPLPSSSYGTFTNRRPSLVLPLNSHADSNGQEDSDTSANKNGSSNTDTMISRRSAFTKTAQIATAASTLLSFTNPSTANANANTEDFLSNINPFTPADRKSINNYNYRPAPRPYSYLVDSTIPPTLVPFQASREAAILKNIGMGSGTPKAPVVEERLNLNNMMNKGVFGTIDFVRDVTGLNDNDDEDGNTDANANVNVAKTATGSKSGTTKSKIYNQSFVFLGVDYDNDNGEDTNLAISLIETIVKPRRGYDTAIALSFVPTSFQRDLNEYMLSSSSPSDAAEETLISTLSNYNDGQIPLTTILNQLPLIRYAKKQGIKLIAAAPELNDLRRVRLQGLQSVDPSQYVSDVEGFIRWTQEPKNKLYTERSLLKDWVPISLSGSGNTGDNSSASNDVESTPGGFFAEKILLHETIATRMANYALRDTSNLKTTNTMVINVGPIADVRFLGGPNGRIARICKAIQPSTAVDDDAVTTILINPSAQETLSQSKFIRLEIGTGPSTIEYQTKVADYLWFSSMPKVNMLPRLMNG